MAAEAGIAAVRANELEAVTVEAVVSCKCLEPTAAKLERKFEEANNVLAPWRTGVHLVWNRYRPMCS